MRACVTFLLMAIVLLSLPHGATAIEVSPGPGGSRAKGLFALTTPPQGRALSVGNITEHHGDLVVGGNDKLVIRNAYFTLYGSLIARDQATVIIENATLVVCPLDSRPSNITVRDNAYIRILSSKVTAPPGNPFNLYLCSNSVAFFSETTFENSHEYYGASEVTVINSTVYWVDCYGTARVNITDSVAMVHLAATDDARLWIRNSKAPLIHAHRNAFVYAADCSIDLEVLCYNDAVMWLVNVSSPRVEIALPFVGMKARIYVSWYLDVRVLLAGEPVGGALVEIFYPNGSLAESGYTGDEGVLTTTLFEKILYVGRDGSPRENYVGNYLVRASYERLLGETNITLDENKEMSVDLLSSLTVRCLDGDGEPVEGVEVRLAPIGSKACSNEEGTVYFAPLDEGTYEITAYYMGVRVAGPETVEITGISAYDLDLPCAIYDLIVLVLSTDGGPVGGAEVELYFANGTFLYKALTDASGRVEFKNLPATSYRLVVTASGYTEASHTLMLEEEGQQVKFTLERQGSSLSYMPFVAAGIGIAVALVAGLALYRRKK